MCTILTLAKQFRYDALTATAVSCVLFPTFSYYRYPSLGVFLD